MGCYHRFMAELTPDEMAELTSIYDSGTTIARDRQHEDLLDHLREKGLLRLLYVPRQGQTPSLFYRLTPAGLAAIGKPPTP